MKYLRYMIIVLSIIIFATFYAFTAESVAIELEECQTKIFQNFDQNLHIKSHFEIVIIAIFSPSQKYQKNVIFQKTIAEYPQCKCYDALCNTVRLNRFALYDLDHLDGASLSEDIPSLAVLASLSVDILYQHILALH